MIYLQVIEAKGLSRNLTSNLTEKLLLKAQSCAGEVMITELAQEASAWLGDHNKPVFESFYEEMEARKKTLEEDNEKKRQMEKKKIDLKESKEKEAVRLEVNATF